MTPQSPNKLLAALPRREFARLQPHLRTVRLAHDASLPYCGETRVYFPGTGLCSITSNMSDGALIEIASVGNEGIAGLATLTGEVPPERRTFFHVGEGTAQWLPLALFEREMLQDGPLRTLVERYCRTFLDSMIQAVACNRLHSLTERCARWLLTTHDRLGQAKFAMRASTLARVLGIKPTELAAVVMNFELLGVIKQDEQTVTIFDAVGLKRLACPCYGTLRRGYADPLPANNEPPRDAERVDDPPTTAKILSMRPPGESTCMLCGSTTRLPHKSDHECIVALDAEIRTLFAKVKALRETRTLMLARRLNMYRGVLKNSDHLA